MRNLIRGLFGEQINARREPPARHGLDVHHRVLVARDPAVVWHELVSPASPPFATDVVVVPVPMGDGTLALASLWRRPVGRLRAGLAEVVTVEEPGGVVTRSLEGSVPVTLTTTCDAMDGGCLVEQRLEGSAAGHAGERVAEFALLWLQRGLIDLKERLEADPGSAARTGDQTTTGERPQVERYASRLTAELGDLDAALGHSGLVPLSAEDSVEVAVPPEDLWDLLTDPGAEHLLRPSTRSVATVEVEGVASELVVALHDDGHGGFSVTASHLSESRRPDRIVERSLTSEFEAAVVTQIEPAGVGSRLTESFVGSVPAGSGSVSGPGPVAELLRTRLEVIRNLAEAGVRPPRDPRTGFLPPGSPLPPERRDAGRPSEPGPGSGATAQSLLSPVLLPPPHLPVPAPVHRPAVDWDLYGLESVFGI